MTRGASPRCVRCRAGRWWALCAALMLIAANFFAIGLRGNHNALAALAPRGAAPPEAKATTASPPPTAPGLAVARSVPVALRIATIGVSVPLSELGLNPGGTVQVPTDFHEPGWYRLGPSPGQVGSAVILGHVDSYKGPAVFFRLRALQEGDHVEVDLADGVVAHFVVSRVEMYPKAHFPSAQVYAAPGRATLQLVTCGGTFDTATGSYLSNVVVYSSLASMTAPVTPPPRHA